MSSLNVCFTPRLICFMLVDGSQIGRGVTREDDNLLLSMCSTVKPMNVTSYLFFSLGNIIRNRIFFGRNIYTITVRKKEVF